MAVDATLRDYPVSRAIPITAARDQLTHLPEEFESRRITSIAVTRRGEPVLAILSWELYASLLETLEILADKDLTATLRECAQEIMDGPGYTAAEVKQRLGL